LDFGAEWHFFTLLFLLKAPKFSTFVPEAEKTAQAAKLLNSTACATGSNEVPNF
jgi:hypothetical protein